MGTPVVNVNGIQRIATLLLADADYDAVGVDDATPLESDTKLNNESNRSAVSQRLQTGATVQVRALHSNGDLPTTLKEIGLFMNATSSPDNGSMVARVLESFTKSTSDLLVVWEITVAAG